MKLLALLDHHDCGEVGIILDEYHNFNEVTSKELKRLLIYVRSQDQITSYYGFQERL